jgi:hypothetical protein
MKNVSMSIVLILVALSAVFSQKGPLKGSGQVVKRSFNNTNFDKLSINDFDGKIEVSVGKAWAIEVSIDDNLANKLEVNQDKNEGILQLSLKDNKNGRLYLEDTNISIKISMPEVSVISHRGNTSLMVTGIEGRYFRLENSGNGNANLQGTVNDLDLTKTGNGTINATKLLAKMAKVKSTGNGSVKVNTSLKLQANGSGNGSVIQYGAGEIDTLSGIVGNGSVRRM